MSKKINCSNRVPVGIIFHQYYSVGRFVTNSLVSKDESVKQANSKIEVALQTWG